MKYVAHSLTIVCMVGTDVIRTSLESTEERITNDLIWNEGGAW